MNKTTQKLVSAAIVGALYAVLTMVLAPISYGPVQCRVSEVMCILPFFMPHTTWGLFLGCAIANIASTAGLADIVFGSLATLFACLCISMIPILVIYLFLQRQIMSGLTSGAVKG